jgi:riboflavin kinase/FMN adenylyltransferase
MKVTLLQDAVPRPRYVAIGTFDGVHRGHRGVIRGADTVVTFDRHPRGVVAPGDEPLLLTTLERKAELIASLGVRELVVIPFDEEFRELSADAFVDHVLVERLQATHVRVGENFRFGRGAAGDVSLLRTNDAFELHVEPLLELDGEIVSSTHIRGLLAAGDVQYAAELLGAPFALSGEVAHGDKRGRELGFPTLNLVPARGHVLPAHGVYATAVRLRHEPTEPAVDVSADTVHSPWITGATNIGVRPQFQSGRGVLVESFLLDWSGDAYGAEVVIEFLTRLRGEQRFPSVDDLVEQMGRDVDVAREVASLRRRT